MARSIGTPTAKGHSRFPERFSPKLPHSSLRFPRGVVVNVMTSSAASGANALSRTLMPACGIATAMPMAMENAITR